MANVAFCRSLKLPLSDNTPPPQHHRHQTRRTPSLSLYRCQIPGKASIFHSDNNARAKARPRLRITCQAIDLQQSKEGSDIEFSITAGQDRLLKVIYAYPIPLCLCVFVFFFIVIFSVSGCCVWVPHKQNVYAHFIYAGLYIFWNQARTVVEERGRREKRDPWFSSMYRCLNDGMELPFISCRRVMPNAAFCQRNIGTHLVLTHQTMKQINKFWKLERLSWPTAHPADGMPNVAVVPSTFAWMKRVKSTIFLKKWWGPFVLGNNYLGFSSVNKGKTLRLTP